jgi:hypothetical protein
MASRASDSDEIITPKKSRWGMVVPPISVQSIQNKIKGLQLHNSFHREAFDEFPLFFGYSASTIIIFHKHEDIYLALRSCDQSKFTAEKKQLVEIARGLDNHSFLSSFYIFPNSQSHHNDETCFVASEYSDMLLTDIIDCTIPLQETHLSTIFNQASL